MLKEAENASNVMDTIGYWREYPERDLEHVRRYPCVVELLSEEEVWEGRPAALYCRIPAVDRDGAGLLALLLAEAGLHRAATQAADRCVRIGFVDGWGLSGVGSAELGEFLEGLRAQIPVAPDAAFSLRCRPEDIDAPEKARVLSQHGFRRVVVAHDRPAALPRALIDLLRESGIAEVGVELVGDGGDCDPREMREGSVDLIAGSFAGADDAGALLSEGYLPATHRVFVAGPPGMRFAEHVRFHGLDVLALGPGARGYLKGVVYENASSVAGYRRAVAEGLLPVARASAESAGRRLRSSTVNGLRLLELSRETYRSIHGFDVAQAFGEELGRLARDGLLEMTDEKVAVSYPRGFFAMESIAGRIRG